MMKKSLNCCLVVAFMLLTACSADYDSRSLSSLNISDGLPPDPGKAGKATLQGIDSDNDGVRDDIQRYIAITYPNSEKIRRVLTDKAKADQEFLLSAADKEKILQAVGKRSKQIACFFYISPDTAHQELQKFRAEMLNTEERIKAYIKADSQLGGMTFRLADDEKSQCSFDPDV